MRKAAHEAKRHTTWTAPNERYDGALEAFVRSVMADAAFTTDVAAFVDTLEDATRRTSLALLLLRLTAPGVPDIYQGSELWDRSLVDPDNRRPVDFDLRRRLLDEIGLMTAADAWQRAGEGVAKLWLLRRVLALRSQRSEIFAGSYQPLTVEGRRGDRVVAFLRDGSLAVVAPRLVAGLPSWGDTALQLPEGTWHDVLQDRQVGACVSLAELLACFPVTLLERR
jgi:(1->4)-alpha-D-glucan 1-alpha-D-glucosylmutase